MSSITYYVEKHYSNCGLASGLLKNSLKSAYDLLDKCGGFINLYFQLQHNEEYVTLNNVWYQNLSHKKGLNQIIKKHLQNNQYLSALKDLNTDLFRGKFPANLKLWRNQTTHKRLTLSFYDSSDEYDDVINYDLFKERTYQVLRLAKASIIYLVGMIYLEEKRLKKENNEVTAKVMYFSQDISLSDRLEL